MQLPAIELITASFVSVIVRSVGAVATLAMTLVLTRQFGADASGVFFLAFAVVTFTGTLSRAGLESTIVRFVGGAGSVNQGRRVTDVLKKALVLSAPLTLFTAALLFSCAELIAIHLFKKPLLTAPLQAMSFAIAGLNLLTLFGMGLQGLRRTISSVSILKIATPLFFIALLTIIGAKDISSAGLYYTIAASIAGVLSIVLFSLVKPQNSQGDAISWHTLTQSSRPLWSGLVAQQITLFSGQILCGIWLSSGDVALIAVALRIAMLTSFILLAVNMVVAPQFAALHNNGQQKELQRLAIDASKLLLIVGLPIGIFLLVWANVLMVQFGTGFDSGATVLRIITIGQLVNIATGSANILLISTGHEASLKGTHFVGAAMSLTMGLLLTPTLGVIGAATATAVGIAVQNIMTVYKVNKKTGLRVSPF